MVRKKFKRIIALAAAAALSLSMTAAPAFASDNYTPYTAHSSAVTANGNILTGAAYAASTVDLSILGVNVTSSNGAGIWNSAGQAAASSPNLGIFGTTLNDNMDPYLANFYYNYATNGGGGDYNATDYSDWTGPYTLRCDSAKSGPSGLDKNTNLYVSINDVTKTFNAAFFYEPDVQITTSETAYDSYLSQYNAIYHADDDDYDPEQVVHVSTMGANSKGLQYNQFEMSEGLVEMAVKIQQRMSDAGKKTRYKEGPYEIAVDYDKYGRGLYYYAQSLFGAENGLTKINYAASVSYNGSKWVVKDATSRQAQYAAGIGNNIYDLLANGFKFNNNGTEYTISAETDGSYLLTTDQLTEILNKPASGNNSNAYGVILGAAGSGSEYTALTNKGIRFLSSLPECVYGMTMQTAENGMGIPFYLCYFYYNQNSAFDPTNLIGYWVKHFYHVSDSDSMATVLSNMLDNADLPAGYTVNASSYSTASDTAVEDMIIAGIKYYLTLPSGSQDWDCLNCRVGIGRSDDALKNIAPAADSVYYYNLSGRQTNGSITVSYANIPSSTGEGE